MGQPATTPPPPHRAPRKQVCQIKSQLYSGIPHLLVSGPELTK